MIRKMGQILVIFMSFHIGKSLECIQKNVSCSDIKTDDGFKYLNPSHNGRLASQIYVYGNETTLAHAVIEEQSFDFLSEVIHMDNHSVTTRHCRDLRVQSILNGGPFVQENCVDYKITEMENYDPLQGASLGLDILISLGVMALFGIAMLALCFHCWKKELRKRQGAATVSGFLTCLRKWIPQPQTPQTGNEEAQLSEITSASDPRGSGEDEEQHGALESVQGDSIDHPADGTTPKSLSLDHNLSNGGAQLSKSGEIRAPDVRTSNPQAMNRNQRDDQGGVNDNKGKETARSRDMSNGWTRPGDHESEGQPLLLEQRPAVQCFDMTGEAAALVNERGFDPDQVSRCSAAPDADVESTSNVRNCVLSG